MTPTERESAHQRVVSACESARYLVSKVMQDEPLNTEARMLEKQASRDQDTADSASGKIKQEELHKKNGIIYRITAKILRDKSRK